MKRRVTLPIFGALALILSLMLAPLAARADGESNEVGACLSADKVWLLVVSDTKEVLANECVGTPANGEAALTAAGLKLGYDSNQFICSIGGHPAECPTTFNGAFWNYYQGKPGEAYAFSQVGAAESKPTGGTIEAWCYSTPEEQTCTPPTLTIVKDGTEVAAPAGTTAEDLPFTNASASASPTASPSPSVAPSPGDQGTGLPGWAWAAIGLGVLVVVAAVAVIVVRQRAAKPGKGTLGGR